MSDTISYSKYPTDGQLTYNGGNFMTSNQASTVGCAGTSCKTLAANSVFTDPIEQGRTLAPATNTATNYNPSCGLSGGAKKTRSQVENNLYLLADHRNTIAGKQDPQSESQ